MHILLLTSRWSIPTEIEVEPNWRSLNIFYRISQCCLVLLHYGTLKADIIFLHLVSTLNQKKIKTEWLHSLTGWSLTLWSFVLVILKRPTLPMKAAYTAAFVGLQYERLFRSTLSTDVYQSLYMAHMHLVDPVSPSLPVSWQKSLLQQQFITFDHKWIIICKSDIAIGIWWKSITAFLQGALVMSSYQETQWVLVSQSSISYCRWHLQICVNIKGDFWGLFSVVEVTCIFTLEARMQK